MSRDSLDTCSARDEYGFPRDPPRVVRSEERHRWRDVVRLTRAAERRRSYGTPLEIAAGSPRGVSAFRDHEAGVDGIHSDIARAQFLGERFRDGVNGAFR